MTNKFEEQAYKVDLEKFMASRDLRLDYLNVVTQYVVRQNNIRDVGSVTAVVSIADKPIYRNYTDNKSIDVHFFLSEDKNLESADTTKLLPLGTGKIKYKAVGAENYRNRIKVNVLFPNTLRTRDSPFNQVVNATELSLVDILAKHEKRYK